VNLPKATLIKWRNRHGVQKDCHACCVAKRRLAALASRAERMASLLSATCFHKNNGLGDACLRTALCCAALKDGQSICASAP